MTDKLEPTIKKIQNARKDGNLLNLSKLTFYITLLLYLTVLSLKWILFKNDIIQFVNLTVKNTENIKNIIEVSIYFTIINFSVLFVVIRVFTQIFTNYITNKGFIFFKLTFFDIKNFSKQISVVKQKVSNYEKFVFSIYYCLILFIVIFGILANLTVLNHWKFNFCHSDLTFPSKQLVVNSLIILFGSCIIYVTDALISSFYYKKSLRMTKEEVERELKEELGNIHLKSFQKNLHEELLYATVEEKVKRSKVLIY